MSTAIASTAGTNHAATRSTSRCTGAFDPCAAATWRTMPASSVAWPTAVASQVSGACALTVPARTASPVCLTTGSLSPVSIASSTVDSPDCTRPSTGTVSPARTTKTSPTRTAAIGTSTSCPSRRHHAVAGCSRRRSRIAEAVLALARPSSSLPSSTSVITIAPASK